MSASADAFRRVEWNAWEKGADAYWESFGALFEPASAELLARLSVSPGQRVLDVATGPGWVAGRAAARGAHALGVDISHAMVLLAARLYPAVAFVQGDAEALPCAASTFDVAVSSLALSHVARPRRMVAELARVTRAGGRVAVTTHDEPGATALVGLVNEAVADTGLARPASLPVGPSIFHHGYPGDEMFASLLEGAGLEHVGVTTIAYRFQTAATDLWDTLSRGSTSLALLLEGQPVSSRRELRAAFVRRATRFGTADQLRVPISIKLATGTHE